MEFAEIKTEKDHKHFCTKQTTKETHYMLVCTLSTVLLCWDSKSISVCKMSPLIENWCIVLALFQTIVLLWLLFLRLSSAFFCFIHIGRLSTLISIPNWSLTKNKRIINKRIEAVYTGGNLYFTKQYTEFIERQHKKRLH